MVAHVEAETIYSFSFLVAALCFVFPPKEVVSAGLTIQNIFSAYLGSEELDFVSYHIRRTTLTLLIHSFLPLAYYVGLLVFAPNTSWTSISILILFCFVVPIIGVAIALMWLLRNYVNHPLVKTLTAHGTPWKDVASQINSEFRSVEKFSHIMGSTRFYVTASWILKCSAYCVNVAQQTDSHIAITKSEEHIYGDIERATHDSPPTLGTQLLHMMVISINPAVKPFPVTLNSVDYRALMDRLGSAVVMSRDIIIRQNVNEMFIEAFTEQVQSNGNIDDARPQNLENCIGCFAKVADITLRKSCGDGAVGESCSQCYCRPMWCIECMARWFSSRQKDHPPNTWMSRKLHVPLAEQIFACLIFILFTKYID